MHVTLADSKPFGVELDVKQGEELAFYVEQYSVFILFCENI